MQKRGDKFHTSIEIETRALPCFSELHCIFYKNGVKVIPVNIYELLTPEALAHLVMGDGNARSHGLIICTDSYSVQDVVRLMNVLMVKYRLVCTLRYNSPLYPRIYISERSIPLLRTIVRPHMHSSMASKIKYLESKGHYTTVGKGRFSVTQQQHSSLRSRSEASGQDYHPLEPLFITGFIDGATECCFTVSFQKPTQGGTG